MTRDPVWLRDDASVRIEYRDETPFGSALTGLCDRVVDRTCAPALRGLPRGGATLGAVAAARLEHCFAAGALGRLYARPARLRDACVHPPPSKVVPIAWRIEARDGVARLGAGGARDELRAIARWLSALARDGVVDTPATRRWLAPLLDIGALTTNREPPVEPGDGVTFVGHATVMIRHRATAVIVDPFLIPASDPSWRPLAARELAVDAVFITHGHPDHHDVGSLLRLGLDTPIYVPVVPRESLLSIDLAARLGELGFTRVTTLAWGERVAIGDIVVDAEPFYGEQATDDRWLHDDVRNCGNTYVVEFGGRRIGLVADAGRDHAGDTITLAAESRRRVGSLDVLFGGYRAWRMYPHQYVGSSVARQLLFVPRERWGCELRLMNDADDLLDTAVAWGAHAVVPYANGGTPWFARIGLGPHDATHDDPHFDPDEDVVSAAAIARRSRGAAAPTIVPLRAGEQLRLDGGMMARRWVLPPRDEALDVVVHT